MFCKVLVLLVASFLLVQANNEPQTVDNYGIVDHVLKLIRKLNDVVLKMIADVGKKLLGLKDKIIELQKGMIALAQKELDKVVNGVLERLEQIKQDAIAMEADVSVCVDENERDIKLIAGTVFFDISRCITKNTMKAFNILSDAMAAVKAITSDVEDLQEEYDKCDNALCYMQMGTKVAGLLVSLPLRGTALFIKAQKTLVLVELEITSCVSQKISALQDDVELTFANVNDCVVEIIGNKGETTDKRLG